MGLFGRRRVSAELAGAQFVHECLVLADNRWPIARAELAAGLSDQLVDHPNFLDDPWTKFYFALAAIGCEIQAVRILVPEEVRPRVIAAAYATLAASQDVGNIAKNLVELIDNHCRDSIADGEMPTPSIPLSEALTLGEDTVLQELIIDDPIAVMSMEGAITMLLPGWWKQFLSKHTIT